MRVEVARGFFHLDRFRSDVKHHRGFDFVRVRATRLAKRLFDGIIFSQIGVVQDDIVFREFGGGLGERPERSDSRVGRSCN